MRTRWRPRANNASEPSVVTLPHDFCTGVKLAPSGNVYLEAYAVSTSTKMSAETGRQVIFVNDSARA